ncbi:KIF-1 binding protein C terminal-domain-containing protein [Ochromonadaceae sp. CCMP2298]|nr:KIF-1 binding protein C terminal-domain-containing protein [Ochromonadaceae sp. CCMP2298]
MYLVDHENSGPLILEYDDTIMEADALCEIADPESEPYKSKYAARKLLDTIINKMDATRAISKLEMKTATIAAMDIRLASAKLRVGTISFECEEPHNAQTDLELACAYYFPDLVEKIYDMCKDDDEEKTLTAADIKPTPELRLLSEVLVLDAMKTLNMMGILWAGRGQVHKSMLFLLSARQFYTQHTAQGEVRFAAKTLKELGQTFTHNLFYLAQAYGNLGDTATSCTYCHQTLQRQLTEGFKEIRTALDWVKNCGGIADFYLAMAQYNSCALALASAESVLRKTVIPRITNAAPEEPFIKVSEGQANFVSGNLNAAEIEAELHRKWGMLDVHVMRRAFERGKNFESLVAMGLSGQQAEEQLLGENDANGEGDFDLKAYKRKGAAMIAGTVFQLAERGALDTPETDADDTAVEVSFFEGIKVSPTALLNRGDVSTFQEARKVFLRAAGRIDAARKYYVLDGYVTDHTTLTQEHSKLYHYLSVFEGDFKRKLAMQNRRLELLSPILKALNISSYEVLHKQLAYELGECSLAMLDMKLDKFRDRNPAGDIEEKSLKKAEVAKCNEYSRAGLVVFAHFTYLYASMKDRTPDTVVQRLELLPLHLLAESFCTSPDEALISADEVRPFLNAHFLSCRILSKVISTAAFWPPSGQRTHFLVCCLRRYEWLSAFAPKICEKRGVKIEETFSEEHKIVQEMVRLLPSKIDRMTFLGESGLSL